MEREQECEQKLRPPTPSRKCPDPYDRQLTSHIQHAVQFREKSLCRRSLLGWKKTVLRRRRKVDLSQKALSFWSTKSWHRVCKVAVSAWKVYVRTRRIKKVHFNAARKFYEEHVLARLRLSLLWVLGLYVQRQQQKRLFAVLASRKYTAFLTHSALHAWKRAFKASRTSKAHARVVQDFRARRIHISLQRSFRVWACTAKDMLLHKLQLSMEAYALSLLDRAFTALRNARQRQVFLAILLNDGLLAHRRALVYQSFWKWRYLLTQVKAMSRYYRQKRRFGSWYRWFLYRKAKQYAVRVWRGTLSRRVQRGWRRWALAKSRRRLLLRMTLRTCGARRLQECLLRWKRAALEEPKYLWQLALSFHVKRLTFLSIQSWKTYILLAKRTFAIANERRNLIQAARSQRLQTISFAAWCIYAMRRRTCRLLLSRKRLLSLQASLLYWRLQARGERMGRRLPMRHCFMTWRVMWCTIRDMHTRAMVEKVRLVLQVWKWHAHRNAALGQISQAAYSRLRRRRLRTCFASWRSAWLSEKRLVHLETVCRQHMQHYLKHTTLTLWHSATVHRLYCIQNMRMGRNSNLCRTVFKWWLFWAKRRSARYGKCDALRRRQQSRRCQLVLHRWYEWACDRSEDRRLSLASRAWTRHRTMIAVFKAWLFVARRLAAADAFAWRSIQRSAMRCLLVWRKEARHLGSLRTKSASWYNGRLLASSFLRWRACAQHESRSLNLLLAVTLFYEQSILRRCFHTWVAVTYGSRPRATLSRR